MKVDAIQFVRPNGEKRLGQLEVDDSLADKVELAKKYNLRVEMEVLQTGEISATISHPEGDVVISIFKNIPGNKKEIDKLFDKLTESRILEFLKQVELV